MKQDTISPQSFKSFFHILHSHMQYLTNPHCVIFNVINQYNTKQHTFNVSFSVSFNSNMYLNTVVPQSPYNDVVTVLLPVFPFSMCGSNGITKSPVESFNF